MEMQSDSGRTEKDYLWREALWGTVERVSCGRRFTRLLYFLTLETTISLN